MAKICQPDSRNCRIFTDRLFSINAVKPYDDTFDALDNGSDEIIRLSSNENPYGPSKFVREKMVSDLTKCAGIPAQN